MKSLKIGGVPEHFNMPWQLVRKSKKLEEKAISIEWSDFPGGTGAMVEALNNGKLDVAILLTEGAVKGIDKGGNYKIIGLYVESPLVWGIHVAANSAYNTIEDVKGRTYAISRYGSGSHLMAFVDAQSRGWPVDNLKFEVVGNLEGAREALKEGSADIFLWEKFTTKKYVDNGEFRRIDECPTPFPCFVICASNATINSNKKVLRKTLEILFKKVAQLSDNQDAVQEIAAYYHLNPTDVAEWKTTIKWAKRLKKGKKGINNAIGILKGLDLIDPTLSFQHVSHKL